MSNIFTGSEMLSTSKKALGLGENLIVKYDALRSFSGTNRQELKDIDIPETGVHFYIGNLSGDESGFYNEDFVKDSLDAMLKELPKDADIHLDMAGSVSILLNPEVPALGIESQISKVKDIIKHDYKKHTHRIHVNNLDDRHEDLLTHISGEDGIEGLGKDILEKEGSLYLAHILYQETEQNKKFLNRIKSTKPGNLKNDDELSDSDYYGLVEMAMRMQDLLDGISLQGGEERQQRYDSIILHILAGKYNKGSDKLEQLHDFFSDKNQLQRLYFSKKKYQHVKDEKTKNSIIRTLFSSTVLALGLSGFFIHDSSVKAKEKTQEAVNRIINDEFKDGNTDMYYGMGNYQSNLSKSEEVLETANRISKQFIARYGTGKGDNDSIEILILNELNKPKLLPKSLPKIKPISSLSYESFIDNVFIPNNRTILISEGIDIEKEKLRDIFLETYTFDIAGGLPKADMNNIKDKEKYTMKDGFQSYEIGFLDCYIMNKGAGFSDYCEGTGQTNVVVARPSGSEEKFSFDDGKKVAYDYLNTYTVKEYTRYVWNIMNEVYGESPDINEITEKTLRLLHDGIIDFDEIQIPDFMKTVSLIEDHFLDGLDSSTSFVSGLQNTFDINSEDVPDEELYGKYIGTITLDNDTQYLYNVIVNNKRYIITSRAMIGNHYQNISAYDFKNSKAIVKQILDLL